MHFMSINAGGDAFFDTDAYRAQRFVDGTSIGEAVSAINREDLTVLIDDPDRPRVKLYLVENLTQNEGDTLRLLRRIIVKLHVLGDVTLRGATFDAGAAGETPDPGGSVGGTAGAGGDIDNFIQPFLRSFAGAGGDGGPAGFVPLRGSSGETATQGPEAFSGSSGIE